MKNLNNKNAVITGGSDGIGLGIAKAFAREGANLLLIGKDPEKLQKAQQALLNEFGVQVHTLSADLSKTETVAEVVKDIEQLLSTVDILVNNAGLGKFVPFEQVDSTPIRCPLQPQCKSALFPYPRSVTCFGEKQGECY